MTQTSASPVHDPDSTADEDTWVAITSDGLSLSDAASWAQRSSCGAVATFSGTVRDHSDGRPGVVHLEYEAYEPHATARLADVAHEARQRFSDLGRIALLHRTGVLDVGEVSVVVVVSAAHRAEAFGATRFCIDAIKSTVPIWKRETWARGSDWSSCSHPVAEPSELGRP